MKRVLLLIVSLLLGYGQAIHATEYYIGNSYDNQGYSITPSHTSGNIVMGGSACSTASSCKIYVQEMTSGGTVVWSKEYDFNSGSERCFKIIKNMDGYILTGYVYDGGIRHYTLVMQLDASGNISWSNTYMGSYPSNAGLYIAECPDLTGFIIAGYQTASPGSSSSSRTGYVMKIDKSGILQWIKSFDSPRNMWSTTDYDMAENVTPVPASDVNGGNGWCYYITGSINNPQAASGSGAEEQKILSLMLEDNGTTVWDMSFASATLLSGGTYLIRNDNEVGVSSIYDDNRHEIFLISNTMGKHGFNATAINPTNGAILMHNHIFPNTTSSACKYSAYQILAKPSHPRKFTVVGMVSEYGYANPTTSTNPLWVMDIDKNTLTTASTPKLFHLPSNGWNSYFNGWLGPHSGTIHPIIFTPDIALRQGDDFFMLGYQLHGFYNIAVLTMDQKDYIGPCNPEDYPNLDGDDDYVHFPISFSSFGDELAISMSNLDVDVNWDYCALPPASPSSDLGESDEHEAKLSIYPSPASSVLNILIEGEEIASVTLYDAVGRVVKKQEGDIRKISLEGLAKGYFTVRIETVSNDVFVRRFIKN